MKTNPPFRGRLLLGGAALLTLLASPAGAEIQVDVNDRQVQFGHVAPTRIDGRVFIPLRAVVEALGAEVRWDARTQTVHGSRGSREFALPVGSRTAQVNGRSLNLDAPARLMSGTTMVPLRFVAEALGANVDWNASEQRVAVTLGGGGSAPPAERVAGESVSGELLSVQSAANPPTLTVRVGASRQTYRMGANTEVTRAERGGRARQVNADQLRPGDQVTVRLDGAGRTAERIEATGSTAAAAQTEQTARTVRGEVVRVIRTGQTPLIIVMVNGARQTYEAGTATVSHRTGRRAAPMTGTLRDVLTGDYVTISLDRTGQIAERIDSTHVRPR